MASKPGAAAKASPLPMRTASTNLPFRATHECPVSLLRLDLENPRLQTGTDFDISTEDELIEVLADIAALDELVLSICTNTYLNLEPLIVCGQDGGPYTVLEGNRRIAAIRLINDPIFAAKLGIKVPAPLGRKVLDSIEHVLVYRVTGHGGAPGVVLGHGARQASCRLIFSADHCMNRLVLQSKSKARLSMVAARARGGQQG